MLLRWTLKEEVVVMEWMEIMQPGKSGAIFMPVAIKMPYALGCRMEDQEYVELRLPGRPLSAGKRTCYITLYNDFWMNEVLIKLP